MASPDELESGPVFHFADWPNDAIPTSPGVYTIWQDEKLLYVGMAGRGVAIAALS